jgi:hypothetical protein
MGGRSGWIAHSPLTSKNLEMEIIGLGQLQSLWALALWPLLLRVSQFQALFPVRRNRDRDHLSKRDSG